jgi:hypothetical protein
MQQELPRCHDPTKPTFLIAGFFWAYLQKNIFYTEKIEVLRYLRQRIDPRAVVVTLETLQRTWKENEYHLDICRTTRSGHNEIF